MTNQVYHSLAHAMDNAISRLETLKRVCDKRQLQLKCPDCGGKLILRDFADGQFYNCNSCYYDISLELLKKELVEQARLEYNQKVNDINEEYKDILNKYTNDLSNKLKIKSDMINMGEKIEFGSETALMDEAANTIDRLENENLNLLHEIKILKEEKVAFIGIVNKLVNLADSLKSLVKQKS